MDPNLSYHPDAGPGQVISPSANDAIDTYFQYLQEDLEDIENLARNSAGLAKKDFNKVRVIIKKIPRLSGLFVMGFFVLVGVTFSGVFVAMQFHWLDVKGSSISRDSFYKNIPKT